MGNDSVLAQRVAEFYDEIRDKKSILKLRSASDDSILTKIQYVFDTRLNTWLGEMYENAENILRVDHNLINFDSIIKSVTYGTFSIELPPNLLPKIPDKKRPAPGDDDEENG